MRLSKEYFYKTLFINFLELLSLFIDSLGSSKKIPQQTTTRLVTYRLNHTFDLKEGINIVDLGLVYGINCREATVELR